jgi:predicted DCC family thiol-disulfide oxidoreductase YuxK
VSGTLSTGGQPVRTTATSSNAPVLLYDADCGFCASSVQFVLKHEGRRHQLRFARLGGELGNDLRHRHPTLQGVDSMIWVTRPAEGQAEAVNIRWDAVLALLSYLGGGWRVIALVGRMIPRSLGDRLYDIVARHRHSAILAGMCVLPTFDQESRFLHVIDSKLYTNGT